MSTLSESNRKFKICIVTTIGISLDVLFPEFYPLLKQKGYEVVGICADTSGGLHSESVRKQGVRVINVPMTREFTIWQDIKCLWALYHIFRKEKFDLIHYSTPKASLLVALAGRLAGHSFLLYTLRGLGYTAYSGAKRLVSRWCEKIACLAAHHVIAISGSLVAEAVRENLLPKNKIEVHGAGSSKGVNLEQFSLTPQLKSNADQIRQELNISKNDVVIGCAGRLTQEKGIKELVEAFYNLSKRYENLHLVLIGDQDRRNPLRRDILERIKESNSIHRIDFTQNFPSYLATMDIFVLPSYREGFGNVIIEASAMQLPVIATDIPGCRDALINEITGLLIELKDVCSLEKALARLIEDPSARKKLGNNGCDWVRGNFDRRVVWKRLIDVYEEILLNREMS